jgi:hypothetical protein
MQLENEAYELERIAKAFRLISKEISYGGLANALLGVAIENSGAVRGTVLLSEGGELLAKVNASFHGKRCRSSHDPDRLPCPFLGAIWMVGELNRVAQPKCVAGER